MRLGTVVMIVVALIVGIVAVGVARGLSDLLAVSGAL